MKTATQLTKNGISSFDWDFPLSLTCPFTFECFCFCLDGFIEKDRDWEL